MGDISEKKATEIENEYRRVSDFYENYIYPLYDKYWKSYLKDESDRYAFIDGWQSNIHTSMTQKMVDVMSASMYDAQTGFGAAGRNKISREKSKTVRGFLDYVYEINNGSSVLQDVTMDSHITGTAFIKTGWDEQYLTVDRVEKGEKKKYVIDSKNNAAFWSVSPYHIKIDPSAESIDSAKYLYETSFDTTKCAADSYFHIFSKTDEGEKIKAAAKDSESNLDIQEKIKKAFIKKIEKALRDAKADTKRPIRKMENRDLIRHRIIMAKGNKAKLQASFGKEAGADGLGYAGKTLNFATTSGISFDFEPDTHEFIERWTDTTFDLLVDGIHLFSIENMMPYEHKPYEQVFFKRIPKTVFGTGIPFSVDDLQDIDNMMANLKLDSAKIFGIPSFKRLRSQNLGAMYEGDSRLDVTPGKIFDVDDKDDLTPLFGTGSYGNMNVLKETEFDLDRDAKETVGVNEYVLGAQGKVERSAAGVKTLLESFKMRLRPFISSLNDAMANVALKWLAMTIAWGDERIPAKVASNDEMGSDIEDINLEDIIGQYMFSFKVDGLTAMTRELDKENLNKLVPLISNLFYDPKTQEEVISVKKFLMTIFDMNDIASEDLMTQAALASANGSQQTPLPDDEVSNMLSELLAAGIGPEQGQPMMPGEGQPQMPMPQEMAGPQAPPMGV